MLPANILPSGNSSPAAPGISVVDALRAYSRGGAWVEGHEARKGSIRPGKLADLVLVDTDPTGVDPQTWLRIRAVLTLIGYSDKRDSGRKSVVMWLILIRFS